MHLCAQSRNRANFSAKGTLFWLQFEYLPYIGLSFITLSSLINIFYFSSSMIMMTLLQSALKYHFVEKLYPATSAGLGYSSYASDKGLVFKVSYSILLPSPLVPHSTEIIQKLKAILNTKITTTKIITSTPR